ncbi:MAG: SDR family oxidoreductase [Candidatus Heimdallarchaeota archaeon]|nr:SDR family oxidoreductase [Candidatus Heimdallarchaeota archaeon]MDH5647886.1 SDR family oxidoreductase [Candidatus Heimdallarchaeota archaeon]
MTKLILITGANAGIGFQTALGLAKENHQIIMVCRNKERGEKAKQSIIQQTGNNSIDLLLADLSLQSDIRNLVSEIEIKYDRIDVLINNAGAIFLKRQETVEGIEKTLATNHLSYFLLTYLLLPKLEKSDSARIINVASGAHKNKEIDFDDIQNKNNYKWFNTYGQSKLANIMFTIELSNRLNGKKITVNALHPGFVASQFAKNNGILSKIVMNLVKLYARNPKKGATTSIYLATAPELEGVTGNYYYDFGRGKSIDIRQANPSKVAKNEENQQKLWKISEEMTQLQ